MEVREQPLGRAREAHVVLRGVSKRYDTGGSSFTALDGIVLTLARGGLVAIVGASGSGKTTLLNLIAGLDRPSLGQVLVAGTALEELSEDALAAWRGRHVGVVFQFFQLLPTLTALENVMLPMDLCDTWPAAERAPRARSLLAEVGVAAQAHKLPSTLSGGEHQRVAIARALANDPPLLLADEPTGNLDARTGGAVLDLLVGLAERGRTVILVTHDAAAARRAARTVVLADARLVAGEDAVLASAAPSRPGSRG